MVLRRRRPRAVTADCDADARARVLVAAADSAGDARAYALDASTLQWPGKPAGGRYRLAWSATAQLRTTPGQPLQGADGVLALRDATAPLTGDAQRAFAFVPAGARLALDAAGARRLREAASMQWRLVQEDAHGRVLDATGVQAAGFLDAAFDGDRAPLGPRVDADAMHFGLWAPTARSVSLCVYDDERSAASAALPMRFDPATGAWQARIDRRTRAPYYTYLVDVVVPGVGLVRNRVTDPYAVALSTDSARSVALDLDDAACRPPAGATTRARRRPPATST